VFRVPARLDRRHARQAAHASKPCGLGDGEHWALLMLRPTCAHKSRRRRPCSRVGGARQPYSRRRPDWSEVDQTAGLLTLRERQGFASLRPPRRSRRSTPIRSSASSQRRRRTGSRRTRRTGLPCRAVSMRSSSPFRQGRAYLEGDDPALDAESGSIRRPNRLRHAGGSPRARRGRVTAAVLAPGPRDASSICSLCHL